MHEASREGFRLVEHVRGLQRDTLLYKYIVLVYVEYYVRQFVLSKVAVSHRCF